MLVLVNVALASEAALYVAVLPQTAGTAALAAVLVRSLVLAATAAMASLILRRESARRGGQ